MTGNRVVDYMLEHPELVALVALPMLGALANALETVTRPRWPRLADFLAALFPHLSDAVRAMASRKQSERLPGGKL